MIDAPPTCHGEGVSIIPCLPTEGKCQCTRTVGSWKHMSGLGLSANRTSDSQNIIGVYNTMPSSHSVPKLITFITSTCCVKLLHNIVHPFVIRPLLPVLLDEVHRRKFVVIQREPTVLPQSPASGCCQKRIP